MFDPESLQGFCELWLIFRKILEEFIEEVQETIIEIIILDDELKVSTIVGRCRGRGGGSEGKVRLRRRDHDLRGRRVLPPGQTSPQRAEQTADHGLEPFAAEMQLWSVSTMKKAFQNVLTWFDFQLI